MGSGLEVNHLVFQDARGIRKLIHHDGITLRYVLQFSQRMSDPDDPFLLLLGGC
jgi:hypothetical protein